MTCIVAFFNFGDLIADLGVSNFGLPMIIPSRPGRRAS